MPDQPPVSRILAVDIGATRIKWGSFQLPLRRDECLATRTGSRPSLGWLNGHLPELFAASRSEFGVAHLDGVAVALCSPVHREGASVQGWLRRHGVPEDLQAHLEQVSGRPVWLVNDAVAWLRGAIRLCALLNLPFERPAYLFTLGTGAGIARVDETGGCHALEFQGWFKGRRVAETAGWHSAVFLPHQLHQIVGRDFFEWVRHDHLDWSEARIQLEFSRRVAAMIRDVCKDRQKLEPAARTVLIGGGHAPYLLPQEIAQRCGARLILLHTLVPGGSSDLVPLLGSLPPTLVSSLDSCAGPFKP